MLRSNLQEDCSHVCLPAANDLQRRDSRKAQKNCGLTEEEQVSADPCSGRRPEANLCFTSWKWVSNCCLGGL